MIMPYTKNDYPNTMKNLPEKVREKATEILNTLLEEKKIQDLLKFLAFIHLSNYFIRWPKELIV